MLLPMLFIGDNQQPNLVAFSWLDLKLIKVFIARLPSDCLVKS